MVTTRSGANSSGNVATPKWQREPEPTPSPNAPRKKRARASKAQDKNLSEELPKGHGLMGMPDEILAEILLGAHPGDLLSLSQTCKLFRNTLMKESAVNIWKSAEGNVPHLPVYPWSDMTPPAYAALLFSKSCTSCGTPTLIEPDPYLLVRFCSSCREVDLVEISKRDRDIKMFYKLVATTNRIRLATKKERRSRGSGPRAYCLRQELESTRDAYQSLLRVGCNTALQRWKEEQQQEVQLRNQFALRLQKFMREANRDRTKESKIKADERQTEIFRRLRELGWKDNEFNMGYNKGWDALVKQPRPLTDRVWDNILPKLVPMLEAKRASLEVAEKEERRKARVDRLSKLLEIFAIKAHPLGSFIRALGLNPESRDTDSNETSQSVVKFLESTPLPDVQAATKWPWVANVIGTDITLQEVDDLFCANLIDIDDRAFNWRRDIEKQLALTIFTARTESNDFDPEDPNWEVGCKLTVKCGESPKSIGFLTGFLLRADTIFCRSEESSQHKKDFTYYPYLTSTFGSWYWSGDDLLTMTVSSYHRYELAEKVSKALLKGIDMIDGSYLELAVMGEAFVCGRCRMQKAKDWKGVVQHYIEELRSWDVSLLVNPRFKTRHPVDFHNAHSLSHNLDDSPLIRIVTAQEMADMAMTTAQAGDPIACLPCKNYARMYVSTNIEAMEHHLDKAHCPSLPAVEGVHYELVAGSVNFLQGGGEWKDRWDAYYNTHDD
ncbi:unnamed protein product [Rhizoctonia solani]|uniref:F-box domain-containing protein n=1 Tax=Rhizoctonia solani TaxID=456999 RepID=A0A8H2WRT0_9AGAM|nr:unnamed protein product [Rhizoctonia solani]